MQGPAPWSEVFRRVPVSALFATWFGTGFLPVAPGTWGSLAALVLSELLYRLFGLEGILGLAGATSLLGIPAAGRVARARRAADPSEVVVDEVAGQSIALAALYGFCPLHDASPLVFFSLAFGSFLLFRLLDVVKPGPIGWLERLPGGLGIMCDDLLAGLLVAAGTAGASLLLFHR